VLRIGLVIAAVGALATVPPARASQIISTSSVSNLQLGVNSKGEAMVSYTAHGRRIHVLAWGAVNAVSPAADGAQVQFRLEYDGGYLKQYVQSRAVEGTLSHLRLLQAQFKTATAARNNRARYSLKPKIALAYGLLARLRSQATNYWKTFSCPTYHGPALAWEVTACQAPDGSYWAVQEWQRQLPDYGQTPTPAQAAMEVHLSHWTGPLAVLTIDANWAYRRYDHLFGTFTYDGSGVYGFHSTSRGAPLDSFGRNLYVDTFDSAYGAGWRRENSFLTHRPGGSFCYGLYPHGSEPSGKGTAYRATIMGPGVTPDLMWEGRSPGPYDPVAQAFADQEIRALDDPQCKPV
jgi:hypothetical protein